MLTYCQKSRRKQATRKSVLFKLLWTALLTYWAYLTVEILKKDADFDSEWDPYKVLKLEDNGTFNSKEVREAYRRLSQKWHPDKVNWSMLQG